MSTTPTTTSSTAAPSPPRPADPGPTARPAALSSAEVRALAARSDHARRPATSFRALLADREPKPARPAEPRLPSARERARLDEPHPDVPSRRPRPLGERRDEDAIAVGLEPFRPPSAVLAPTPAVRTVAGSTDRAEAAALAERLLTGLRVGRIGAGGHLVQLRVRGPGGADLDVRIRHEQGRLGIVLAARDALGVEAARRIERALREELTARGLDLDAIEIEDAR